MSDYSGILEPNSGYGLYLEGISGGGQTTEVEIVFNIFIVSHLQLLPLSLLLLGLVHGLYPDPDVVLRLAICVASGGVGCGGGARL